MASKLGIDTLTIGPAYGRDYKSKAEVMKAFDEGRDFICYGQYQGTAVTQGECFEYGVNVQIRYSKLEKVIYIPHAQLKDTRGVIPEWDEKTFGPQDDDLAALGLDEDDIRALESYFAS